MDVHNNVISICMAWCDSVMNEPFTNIVHYDYMVSLIIAGYNLFCEINNMPASKYWHG